MVFFLFIKGENHTQIRYGGFMTLWMHQNVKYFKEEWTKLSCNVLYTKSHSAYSISNNPSSMKTFEKG